MVSDNAYAGDVLRVLAFGDAEPAVAAPVLRPFLNDKKRLPFAALALARMGQSIPEAVNPLAELLGGSDAVVALEALESIGPDARAALPRFVVLASQVDATCITPVDSSRLVSAVAAIATQPEDAGIALKALAKLLRCSPKAAAEGIARLKTTDGRKVLVNYLRDEANSQSARLEVANVLQREGVALAPEEQSVVRMLEAQMKRRLGPEAQAPATQEIR